jgi:hypothetical protein
MVDVSKDKPVNAGGVKHHTTNYPVSVSPNTSSKVPLVSKTNFDSHDTHQNYNGIDWSRKLNTLINAYDGYRQNFNDLLGTSPTLLRAIEGLYPDYGQYENVPNSGWSHYTPVSLHQQNALSIPDKIAYGTKIYNMPPATILMDEKGAEELSKLHEQDGGINHNNADRYTKKFNKALLAQLKSYVDLDNLATKTDDISRLAYTRLKSYFDTMEILIDDEKLQEFTGVSIDVNKEKDLFITKRLLPDPFDAIQKGKPLSLWAEEDKKIGDALKTSQNFDYIKQYLLDTPTTLVSDPNSVYNQTPASFMNPYESLSDTVKNMLNVRRSHIEDYAATLPAEQAKKTREAFFDDQLLGKYAPPTGTHDSISITKGVLPESYRSISSDFFKKQKSKFDNPLTEFQRKSKDILAEMNIKDSFYIRKDTGIF